MAVFIGFPLCTPAVDSQSQSLSLTASQQWPEGQAISHKDCWDLLVQSVETVVTGFIMYPLSWCVYWICSRTVIRKGRASKQHPSRCTHPMAVLNKYLHLLFIFWQVVIRILLCYYMDDTEVTPDFLFFWGRRNRVSWLVHTFHNRVLA